MILYLAADLIWATRIKSTAESLGLSCRPVRSLEMLEARLGDQTDTDPVTALILDLEKPEEAMAMIALLRGPPTQARTSRHPVRILAFGPHVAKDLFQQARDAGADEVLPRGAFDHALPQILLSLAGRAT